MRNTYRYFGTIAGLVLFVLLVRQAGWRLIAGDFHLLGWGVLALLFLSGIRHLLRTMAWSWCAQTRWSHPGPSSLFGPRLVGEALNDLTPAGPLVGEPAKIVLASRLVPSQVAISSVVTENLVYAIGALLFMMSGLVLALVTLTAQRHFFWMGGGMLISSAAALMAAVVAVNRQIPVLGNTLDYLRRWQRLRPFLDRHEEAAREVERLILYFFRNDRRAFCWTLAVEIATNFTGVAEAYLILNSTGSHATLLVAYLVESTSRAVQVAFSFIPLGLGIQEGTAAATLQALGLAASQGVSLAVIRKFRSLFWAAVGLLFAAKYSTVVRAPQGAVAEP